MAKAGAEAGGGMLALLKATPLQARQLAERFGATVANDNAPGQIVLAGEHRALRQIAAAARNEGLRAMQLDVAGAFHSPAMAAAAASFREALHEVEFRTPRAPVYSSCTAAPFEHVRTELANAITRPVQWRQTMTALDARGITRYVDVGPGAVLAKLVTRNVENATVVVAQEELTHVRA
jgi:malonyl CoA-acyl carrier protein transacylase